MIVSTGLFSLLTAKIPINSLIQCKRVYFKVLSGAFVGLCFGCRQSSGKAYKMVKDLFIFIQRTVFFEFINMFLLMG